MSDAKIMTVLNFQWYNKNRTRATRTDIELYKACYPNVNDKCRAEISQNSPTFIVNSGILYYFNVNI